MYVTSISPYDSYYKQLEYKKKMAETSVNTEKTEGQNSNGLDAVKTSNLQDLKAKKYESDSKTLHAKDLPWYPILVELGIRPSGDARVDYVLIMSCLDSRLSNAKSTQEQSKLKAMMSAARGLFVKAGVAVDELDENMLGKESKLERTLSALANYNKTQLKK